MKTNVIMFRPMGQFTVKQRTKDGMFDATSLLKQWNSTPGNPQRDLSKFWDSSKINEFLEALVLEGILTTPKEGYLKREGRYGGTWMHPYLFIKFAMWLNPRFEVQVIRFVFDQLIKYRHEAGDNYRLLTQAASRFENVNYAQLAKALNYLAFGMHGEGLRQLATQDQLNKLQEIEQKLAFACDMGYINSFDRLINEMRKLYHKMNDKF
jgi:hypothetical protein